MKKRVNKRKHPPRSKYSPNKYQPWNTMMKQNILPKICNEGNRHRPIRSDFEKSVNMQAWFLPDSVSFFGNAKKDKNTTDAYQEENKILKMKIDSTLDSWYQVSMQTQKICSYKHPSQT